MTDRKPLPGKFVWFELISSDAKRAQAFYAEVLGWKIRPFPMGDAAYDMIFTGDALDTMIGGFGRAPRQGERSRWVSNVSVEDVDAAAAATTANGGTLLDPPADLPGIARAARITDPQGAELWLFKRTIGDTPDKPTVPEGAFFWNELHTPDPAAALAFYGKVLGYSHREMSGDPNHRYYALSRDGVARAGVVAGTPAHWLPYVHVTDPDAVVARAKRLGGTIATGATDIPGIGRFAVLVDPTGATFAVMKPVPMAKAN